MHQNRLLNCIAAGKRPGAAMTEAYDDNIDTAVSLGWSYVERVAFAAFSEEIASAPSSAQSTLMQLATLYGLTRIERGLSFFLASGMLSGCVKQGFAGVRAGRC